LPATLTATDVLPKMARIRQRLFSAPLTDDALRAAIADEMGKLRLGEKISPGQSVAIGAGSRGIDRYAMIVGAVVQAFAAAEARPFVYPAMGSHGGATAEGQRGVLASLGITEETIGCPIKSDMDVVALGQTPQGLTVYLDKNAAAADHVFVVNRIKPHTNFRGRIESGMMKMLAIGSGKHVQASTIHRYGVAGLTDHMPHVARAVMSQSPVLGGLAILEDALHTATRVVAVPTDQMELKEMALLEEVRAWQPNLPADELDLLMVDRIGKEISGVGMDPNVIGRCRLIDFTAFDTPRIAVITLHDLTEKTAGNALGVGMADIVTRRIAEKYDLNKTSINALVGFSPAMAALPIAVESDRDAIERALTFLMAPKRPETIRAIHIRDTLNLETMEVSEAVAEEIAGRDGIDILSPAEEMEFDAAGNFAGRR